MCTFKIIINRVINFQQLLMPIIIFFVSHLRNQKYYFIVPLFWRLQHIKISSNENCFYFALHQIVIWTASRERSERNYCVNNIKGYYSLFLSFYTLNYNNKANSMRLGVSTAVTLV